MTVGEVTEGVGLETSRRYEVLAWVSKHGIIVAFVAEIALFSILSSKFMTPSNWTTILLQSAIVGLLAVPSALVLISGYVDLSIGSVLGFSAVTFGLLAEGGMNPLVAGAAGIAVATAVGLFNGYLVAYLRFSSIVVTLGTLAAVRGLAFVLSGGKFTSRFRESFLYLGRARLRFTPLGIEIPFPVLIAAVAFVLGSVYLYKTRWGRHTVALGVNPVAAYHAGVNTKLIPFMLFAATGFVAGLAGLILASRLNSAPPTVGQLAELDVLTAVLLGGVAFGGGRGTLLGVLAGVLFIGVLGNGLILLGVTPFWLRVASGIALILAAGSDALNKRLFELRRGGGPTGSGLVEAANP